MRAATGSSSNSWFNTQTVNFLGTLQATPDDRFTVKFINNDLDTRLPIRLSLNQYYQNPFQQGCETAGVGGLRIGVAVQQRLQRREEQSVTAVQAGLGRDDRRTIVGGRWEHDFDNTTTWRNQFVFDDRNISQPTGATSAIGDFPSYNYMSDVTKRGEIFGHGFDHLFRRLLQHADGVERHAQRHAGRQREARPSAEQYVQRYVELRRSRARRTQADAEPDGGRRHRMGNDASEGDQHRLTPTTRSMSRQRRPACR